MYSICVRSSYGRICASYFCIVGSAVTRLMAETLPRWKPCYFRFSFIWPPSHACGYPFCFIFFGLRGPWRIVRRCGRTRNHKKRDDRNSTKLCVTATRCHHWQLHRPWKVLFLLVASLMVIFNGQEEIRSFCSGHCFFSFFLSSFLFQPLCFCFPVHIQYVSNLKWHVCVWLCPGK